MSQCTARMYAKKCGWKADIYNNGWVTIYNEKGTIISMHSEDFNDKAVIEKYTKDGWEVIHEQKTARRDRTV